MGLRLSALVGLPLILALSTIELDILNKEVLFRRHANSVVRVHIKYPSQEMLPSLDNLQQLCFTLNGRSCKCFSDFLAKEVTLPTECISDDHYWFAVTLSAQQTNSTAKFISYPISIPSRRAFDSHEPNPDIGLISLVLPVTLDDLSRCAILLKSLRFIEVGEIAEMFIFVPDRQRDILGAALSGFFDALSFKVSIIAESALFCHKSEGEAFPYAIQMAIKLLAARIIKTEYYLTLDADILLLQPLRVDQIVNFAGQNNLISHGLDGKRKRALYDHEERFLHHPNWWSGSEELLSIRNERSYLQGFGVTPSLLSTFGSLLTLASIETAMIERIMSAESFNCSNSVHASSSIAPNDTEVSCSPVYSVDSEMALRGRAESLWLESFGRNNVIWSEYTLYRTVLDHYEIFDRLHVRQVDESFSKTDNHDNTGPLELTSKTVRLHCCNIWFASQSSLSFDNALNKSYECLFSVIQSTAGISPSKIYSAWEEHLVERELQREGYSEKEVNMIY